MHRSIITEKNREIIVSILSHNNAEQIAIFGSYARGNTNAKSDLDIRVRFSPPKSLLQIVRIEDELKQALDIDVDLVTENAVSQYLTDAIHCDEVVIYDNQRSCIPSPYS